MTKINKLCFFFILTIILYSCHDEKDLNWKYIRFINLSNDTLYVEMHTSPKDTILTSILNNVAWKVKPLETVHLQPPYSYNSCWDKYLENTEFCLYLLVFDEYGDFRANRDGYKELFIHEHLQDQRLFYTKDLDSLHMTILYPFK